MSSAIALPNRPGHTGQATQIEQARAQAEVLAAVEAAKRWPRDEDACEEKMKRACARQIVADKAFWAFPRSGEQLTGPTIHLAVTLAGVWGNVQYGVVELERDPVRRESQMLAVAWELETNTRATTTFLVPHVRDTKSGKRDLTDLRDVYENNANMGARRVREMIYRVLPDWYTETAQDICRATLERHEKPIEQQRSEVGKALVGLGVTKEQIEAKVGRGWDDTTPGDMAILRIIAKSIQRGEATAREQFPAVETRTVTAAAVASATAPAAPPEPAPEAPPEPEDTAPAGGSARMFALLGEAGLSGNSAAVRDRRLKLMGCIVGRAITSSKDLTAADRDQVIDALARFQRNGDIERAEECAREEAELEAARVAAERAGGDV